MWWELQKQVGHQDQDQEGEQKESQVTWIHHIQDSKIHTIIKKEATACQRCCNEVMSDSQHITLSNIIYCPAGCEFGISDKWDLVGMRERHCDQNIYTGHNNSKLLRINWMLLVDCNSAGCYTVRLKIGYKTAKKGSSETAIWGSSCVWWMLMLFRHIKRHMI